MKKLHSDYTHLGYARVSGSIHQHVIDTKTDSTHLLNNTGMIVFSVDSNARLFDEDDVYLGTFYTNDSNCWYYQSGDKALQPLKTTDLLYFERLVFAALKETDNV